MSRKPYRLYDDGTTVQQRAAMRREAWSKPDVIKRSHRWTEKLCTHCGKWHRYERQQDWCQPFSYENGGDGQTSPHEAAIHVDKGYFNPNLGPGGTWVKSREVERHVMKLYGVEPKH